MNFLRLQEVMVQKIHPKGAPGVSPKSPLSFDFKKTILDEVFRPYLKRSLSSMAMPVVEFHVMVGYQRS